MMKRIEHLGIELNKNVQNTFSSNAFIMRLFPQFVSKI